ncbi:MULTISPECIES: hypothetical protein [unclassified Sphingobium]|uniref:hypothetical protein n=1 Tax=unclassified Sphingobium TaxID=2611147 RepID=UPI0035A6AB92
MRSLARAHCRDYIDVLRFMPRNAAKRFPKLTARQAADRARTRGEADLISAANANIRIAKLTLNMSSFLKWAVNEEPLARNPACELRLPDPVNKRDNRSPL